MAVVAVKGTFPLGANVVGILNLLVALYIMLIGSAYIAIKFLMIDELCDRLNEEDEDDLTTSQIIMKIFCEYPDTFLYVFGGILIYGFLHLICSAMLLAGVKKNSTCLLMPYLIWTIVQIVGLFVLAIVQAVNMETLSLVLTIVGALLSLIIPMYFWFVVLAHQNETRKFNAATEITKTPIIQMYPDGMQSKDAIKNDNQSTPTENNLKTKSPLFSRRNSSNPTPDGNSPA